MSDGYTHKFSAPKKLRDDVRKLAGIDEETGEVTCVACLEAESENKALAHALDAAESKLKGAERDLNGWRVRFEELRRDKEAEAREHELWNSALDLFDLWRRAAAQAEGKAKPKRSKFSADRFFLVLPFLKKYDLEMCQRAIIGRCFDHYGADGKVRRKNGSPIHYCEFERIFGAMGQGKTASTNFEESCNRAPADWRRRIDELQN